MSKLTAFVILVLVFFVSPLFLLIGWNYGLVGAIDGVHELSYAKAFLVEIAIGSIGWRLYWGMPTSMSKK